MTSLDELLRAGASLAVDEAESPEDRARIERRRQVMRRHRFGLLEAEGELVVLDRLHGTRALELAKAWVPSPATYLTLVGALGVGKSTAASWAALELPGSLVYCLEGDVAEWFRFQSTKHEAAWRAAIEADVLVVDGLGDVDLPRVDAARVGLSTLDLARRGRGGRTILAGDVSPSKLSARHGESLLDRLQDEPHAWIELLTGPSLRRSRG